MTKSSSLLRKITGRHRTDNARQPFGVSMFIAVQFQLRVLGGKVQPVRTETSRVCAENDVCKAIKGCGLKCLRCLPDVLMIHGKHGNTISLCAAHGVSHASIVEIKAWTILNTHYSSFRGQASQTMGTSLKTSGCATFERNAENRLRPT